MGVSPRTLLITSALPYANGPLHAGHCLEFIQTDVFVRYQRLCGHTCHYVCGSDTHGTPIMLRAQHEGCTPEALVTRVQKEHAASLDRLLIALDCFHTTHTPESEALAQNFFKRLKDRGDISQHTIEQYYDPSTQLFLADRYLKGTCPRCGAEDQHADSCEACGATYSVTELKNPRSALSQATPVLKQTQHFFFDLNHYQEFLKAWIQEGGLQSEVANKLGEWLKEPLRSWDISRNAPYFGFRIPDSEDLYFYVWLDAPMGYMSAFAHHAQQQGHPEWFEQAWSEDSTLEVHHFIGKDIIYFHGLFWPALLKGAGYRRPTAIWTHGFVTLQGQKMSKSKGTFITADALMDTVPAEALRYYFASKLSPQIADVDLNGPEMAQKINAELVGKYANLASRCAALLHQHTQGTLGPHDAHLLAEWRQAVPGWAKAYNTLAFASATQQMRELCDTINAYVNEHQPWKRIKTDLQAAHQVLSTAIQGFYLVTLGLAPILPETAEKACSFLNAPHGFWPDDTHFQPLPEGHTLHPYTSLWERLSLDFLEPLMPNTPPDATTPEVKQKPAPAATARVAAAPTPQDPEALEGICTIDQFALIDLRVGLIQTAEPVPEANKLLRLVVDLGAVGTRQIFAGVKAHFSPEDLQGQKVLVLANLKPRTMRFGVSEGMMLVASDDDGRLHLIQPHPEAQPGAQVR